MGQGPEEQLLDRAAVAVTIGQMAALLRALRRRHARQRRDRELTYRQIASRTGWSTTAVLRQLPPSPRHFSDSAEELARLDRLVDDAKAAGVVAIAAIDGAVGVGKTTLAAHWAHRTAHRLRNRISSSRVPPPATSMVSTGPMPSA